MLMRPVFVKEAGWDAAEGNVYYRPDHMCPLPLVHLGLFHIDPLVELFIHTTVEMRIRSI